MRPAKEMAIKSKPLTNTITLVLITYAVLHLIEEGFFGFPAWAELRWGIPNYTTSKWFVHNIFFFSCLILGFFLYLRSRKARAFGLGILVWGGLNTLNHVVFSLIFMEYSPGLVTSSLFSALAYIGFKQAQIDKPISVKESLSVLALAVLYWAIPMAAFISVDIMLGW